MPSNFHLSPGAKVGNLSPKTDKKSIKIRAAQYMNDYSVAVTFSTGVTQLINFLPLFEKYVKGDNLKYFSLERFRKFIVKNGNIYWGKNEDVIFPVTRLVKKINLRSVGSGEYLYVL